MINNLFDPFEDDTDLLESVEMLEVLNEEKETINEFYIFPKDKQGKSELRIMVRNKYDDGRNNVPIGHDPSLKIENPKNGELVPVYIDLKDNGDFDFPKEVSKENQKFIKGQKDVILKIIEDDYDGLKEYWYSKDQQKKEEFKSSMMSKYPRKKKN